MARPVTLDYTPRGAARQLFHCRAPEVLLSGPAGTGKSLACLWKLHYCASNKPGVRALILRKTRSSVTESALVTFERDVLAEGDPLKRGVLRRLRQSYRYANGSEIIVGGLSAQDNPARVMSTEYDLIYVQEAVELSEAEWESLTTRLRNGVLAYQQLLADTNPDRPTHWLKQRCDRGTCVLLESRHEDNPTVTPAYLATLDALTGPRKERLRWGRWVQAEGVVYEGWDRRSHLLDPFPIPADWRRVWVVDFGYTNPFVCQFWALDPDGRAYLYREVYHTRRLVEDHARRILELAGWRLTAEGELVPAGAGPDALPVAVICDHDAEDRATLERHLGLATIPATKDKSPGIQAVAARLRPAGDGRPRLFLLAGALDRRDPALDAARRPCCTEEEWDSYVWDTRAHRMRGEEPVKEHDHGMDCVRYLCAALDLHEDEPADDGDYTVLEVG